MSCETDVRQALQAQQGYGCDQRFCLRPVLVLLDCGSSPSRSTTAALWHVRSAMWAQERRRM